MYYVSKIRGGCYKSNTPEIICIEVFYKHLRAGRGISMICFLKHGRGPEFGGDELMLYLNPP